MHIVEVSENLGGFHRFFQLFTVWTIETRLKETIKSSLVKDFLFKHFTNHFWTTFYTFFQLSISITTAKLQRTSIIYPPFIASNLQITCLKTSPSKIIFFIIFIAHSKIHCCKKYFNCLVMEWKRWFASFQVWFDLLGNSFFKRHIRFLFHFSCWCILGNKRWKFYVKKLLNEQKNLFFDYNLYLLKTMW